MKVAITAVFDKKSKTYQNVKLTKNVPVAVRDFSYECQNKQSALNIFPEDYELCVVGYFDVDTGKIESIKKIEKVARAKDFVTKEKECPEDTK